MFGEISYLPTYLQIVTGVSAASSGLLLLALIGGLLVTSIASGRLIARTGRYKAYPVTGTAQRDRQPQPGRVVHYSFSTFPCVPNALSQEGGYSLGAQAGEEAIRRLTTDAGYTERRCW